jgi:predicted AAA+ superfamily ATPase
MILRKLASELQRRLTLYPAVAILGPRQVGKTTLVKQLLHANPQSYLYLDLENFEHRQILGEDRFFFFRNQTGKTIILDEIQFAPDLFKDLRSLIDENRENGRFILLGSASPALLRNAAESLTGRISFLEMRPLLLCETGGEEWKKLWLRGGYPGAFLAKTIEDAYLINYDILQSYLHRDLPSYGLSTETRVTELVLRMLAGQHGQILNTAEIAKSIGKSNTLVIKVLDFLENSFMIRKLSPWYVNHGKRLTKRPKFYIRNPGLLHHLLFIRNEEALLHHYLKGSSWEGFVIEQIEPLLPGGYGLYFYRTSHGNELDLVVARGIEIVLAVEIKMSGNPTLSRSNRLALEDLNNPPLLIVVPGNEILPISPEVTVCGLGQIEKQISGICT